MQKRYFTVVHSKEDFDWFLKKFRIKDDWPGRYKRAIERRLGKVCVCYDGYQIGQNDDNGYFERVGYTKIYRPKFTEYYEGIKNIL